MEPLTDATVRRLTHRLVLGDASALAVLYEARFNWMLMLLQRTTRRDESFSLDCAQDAWLRVARAPVCCESAAMLDAWLRRVALSAALDRVRSDAARRLREITHARVHAHEAASELHSMLQSIDSLSDALGKALDRCGSDERGVLLMRFRAGMTLGQIAASCGVGTAAIDSRLRRLLSSLRASMNATPEEGAHSAVGATTHGRKAERGSKSDEEVER